MSSGGKRSGAGRPKGQGKFGEVTKPVRIPVSMIDSVMTFIQSYDLSLPIYSNKVNAGLILQKKLSVEECTERCVNFLLNG